MVKTAVATSRARASSVVVSVRANGHPKALEEMSGESVTEAWAVRLGKKAPEFEVRKVGDLDTAFIAFRAAQYLWKAMRGGLL